MKYYISYDKNGKVKSFSDAPVIANKLTSIQLDIDNATEKSMLSGKIVSIQNGKIVCDDVLEDKKNKDIIQSINNATNINELKNILLNIVA
ncbi:MAG: hypothetical protein NVSMB66_6130 [Candidatus Doudnabacteria bacterium]